MAEARVYTPGTQNAPFGLHNTNPESSNYAAESANSVTESNLIAKEIKRIIFDAAPKQYDPLKILMAKPMELKNSDEFEYLEHGFGRSVLTSNDTAAAQAGASQTVRTEIITFVADSVLRLGVDMVLVYPDNTKCVVTGISGNDVTVASRTGGPLPQLFSGDKFSIAGTIRGDGMAAFSNYERLEVITRYNYIQFFLRAARWDRAELIKHINKGTTDFVTKDKQHRLKQLRVDLFASYFNGERGEYTLSNSVIAKGMGGLFPLMENAGSAQASPTTFGLESTFENLAFKTNYKAEGGVRFIYGTSEMLNLFAKIYKNSLVRFDTTQTLVNLNLWEIVIGTMRFVLVPCELFREQSVFPTSWARRLIVVDQETIRPCIMKGIPAQDSGETLSKGKRGTREDFTDWYVEAQLGLEYNNPLGGFILNIA